MNIIISYHSGEFKVSYDGVTNEQALELLEAAKHHVISEVILENVLKGDEPNADVR